MQGKLEDRRYYETLERVIEEILYRFSISKSSCGVHKTVMKM